MGLSLKGPPRQGSSDMDEGDLTRGVVARYAASTGDDGQAAAEKVLPARRELWRLVEALAPRALAAALRARLAPSDQSGRGGVRELRAALADWLDPRPTCAHCGNPFDPVLATSPARLACPSRRQRLGLSPRRPRRPIACAAHRGPHSRTGHDAHPTLARCGTLALFTPIHLDPTCWAAQRMLKHGGSLAYDIVVDRDARILLSVTSDITGQHPQRDNDNRASACAQHKHPPCAARTACLASEEGARARDIVNEQTLTNTTHRADLHTTHLSTSRRALAEASRRATADALILTARRNLDRALARAIEQNGRLILATQVRYFAPKGGVTRADLVQGGALGCRRALLDYDHNFRPKGKSRGVRFSTYGINWIHQGCGDVFAERELVSVPQWCLDLRADVVALGLSPGLLLAHILAVVETRDRPASLLRAALDLAGILDAVHLIDGDGDGHNASEDAPHESDEFVVVHTCHPSTSVRLITAANRKPPKGKHPPTDERSAEQVAALVAEVLGLECGAGKPCTGSALLTALRSGQTPSMVPVSTGGERDDASGGDSDASTSSGGNSGLEHLQSTDEHINEEDAALEEEHDRRQHAATLAALASLRAIDPDAAEVIRRHHGLDTIGDGETFAEVVSRPLASGRTLCRMTASNLYKRGLAHLQAFASSVGFATAPTLAPDDPDEVHLPPRLPHGPFRPLRPSTIVLMVATPHDPTRDDDAHAPESFDPEAWAPAAMAF